MLAIAFAAACGVATGGSLPKVAFLSHGDLVEDGEAAREAIRAAFTGSASFGLLVVRGIPGFADKRRAAFNATMRLAVDPPVHSRRLRNAWPGFRHPSDVQEPLQGGFLHNMLEDVGPARVDPVFGKTPWPDAAYRATVVAMNELIYDTSHRVLSGVDRLVGEEAERTGSPAPEVPLGQLLRRQDFLYSLFKYFRAEFSRGDNLFEDIDGTLPTSLQAGSQPEDAVASASFDSNSGFDSTLRPPSHAGTCATAEAAEGAAGGGGGSVAELSSMRTHSASSRAAKAPDVARASEAERGASGGEGAASSGGPESFWLPWHIDPNTISTLTGDSYFDFDTSKTIRLAEYPEAGLGLVALNALGDVVHLSRHIDESSLVVMMAAGAQVHTGGLLRGCMHAVQREAAPRGASRIMYYQAWYGPGDHKFEPPPGSGYSTAATTEASAGDGLGRRVRSVVDPIVNAVHGRTQRTVLLSFRRQFQRLSSGNEADGSQARFEALAAALPLAEPPADQPPAPLTVDVMTDLSCPLAYLGLKRLSAAIASLGLDATAVRLRFHPVFVNPLMDPDGEEMGAYMLRRRNLSLADYNDAAYPLNVAAAALNFSYAKGRRVIHPRRAHLAVAAAAERDRAPLYAALARAYFEGGEDISDVAVLLRVAAALGVERDELRLRRAMEGAEGELWRASRRLDPLVDAVPHFLVRESASGSGLELHGPLEVAEFADALRTVRDAAGTPPPADGFGLQQPPGMLLPGFGGEPTRVPTADRRGGASIVGLSLRGWEGPGAWPYVAGDFSREDEADDAIKYASPSFASHVDAAASASLTQAYSAYFGSVPAGSPLALLDTAASWTSHYPPLPVGSRVAVHGLNAQELAANGAATEVAVGDLNKDPTLPYADGEFDVVTNAASIAYLTRPRELFAEVHRVLKPGGLALVSFSDRVFAEKATALWLSKIDEDVALCSVVRAFFAFGPMGGWRNVSSVDLSPHPTEGDPLWMVTAVKA